MRHVITTVLLACAGPAYAIDPCLVGVWEADSADLAHIMGAETGGQTSHVSGRVSLEITATGVMTLLAENFKIQMEMPGMPPTAITVTGYSQGAMNADDGRNYVANAPEYDLVGSADILGQPFEISADELSGGAWGQSRGIYGCSGNTVAFEADRLGSIPRRWVRVP